MESTGLTNEELIDNVRTWAAHGGTSCAHWLSWQLGWCDTTAREHVRVARALRELPLIRAALGEGRLSYSRVRAVTRMATPAEEPRWLALARHCTGGQLDKIARGAARAKAAETPDEERPVKRAAQVEWDEDGDLVLTLRIPAHEAVPVLAVLEQQRSVVQAEREEGLRELLAAALPGSASAEAPPVPSDSASAEAQGPLAADDAKGHDVLQPYPCGEPDYPMGPARTRAGRPGSSAPRYADCSGSSTASGAASPAVGTPDS